MTDIEHTLRLLFSETTDPLPERPVRAVQAWRRGRIQHRTRVLAGAGAGIMVVAGGAASLSAFGTRSGHPSTVAATETPSAMSSCPGAPTSATGEDALVDAVCLPDPAPGFPVRTRKDSSEYFEGRQVVEGRNVGGTTLDGQAHASRDFFVAQTARVVIRQSQGEQLNGPTGPEAEIDVTTPGVFSTSPDADGTINGHPVIDAVTVHGQPGYLVQNDPGDTVLYFTDGGLSVSIDGSDYTYHATDGTTTVGPNLPVEQLVALGNSLQNLP